MNLEQFKQMYPDLWTKISNEWLHTSHYGKATILEVACILAIIGNKFTGADRQYYLSLARILATSFINDSLK